MQQPCTGALPLLQLICLCFLNVFSFQCSDMVFFQDEKHTYEKNGMILDLVETSGFEAYETFKKILVETNHIDLVEKLNEEEKRILSEGKSIYEPRCEKTGFRGFPPGPTQTRLYSHRRWLEA